MAEYLHGAYGTTGTGYAAENAHDMKQAFVYVGAAPILQVSGWADRINTPVLVTGFSDAVEKFGYSDDWETWPLCEAMYDNFVLHSNGPIVMINTFNPEDDGRETVTGVYAVRDVYSKTGKIPAYIIAADDRFRKAEDGEDDLHKALKEVSLGINDRWNAMILTDLPSMSGEEALTLAQMAAVKTSCAYTAENEITFGMNAVGEDGKVHRLSMLAAAELHGLMLSNDGVPKYTFSNAEVPIEYADTEVFTAETEHTKSYSDADVSEYLNRHGICGACWFAGAWRLWGNHSADYDDDTATAENVSAVNRMMLYYLTNDFQERRWTGIDKPVSKAAIQTIVAQEQQRLDALIKTGALCFGTVTVDGTEDPNSDMMTGNVKLVFSVTVTPLAKSLTAKVSWTDDGLSVYFDK